MQVVQIGQLEPDLTDWLVTRDWLLELVTVNFYSSCATFLT